MNITETRATNGSQRRRPGTGTPAEQQIAPVLAQQYGGRHTGGWVSSLPEPWIPYVQLARLSPPAGVALIYFPHLFGALLAAITQDSPPGKLLRTCAVLLPWSFFFSNAAHAWNDIVDAPLDAAVARTRQRPIPRGAISSGAALVFAISQAIVGVAFLHSGLAGPEGGAAARYVLPNALATVYYPYAKRHTHFAQFVLGFCLAWGVLVGCASMGQEPFAIEPYISMSSGNGRSSPSSLRISPPVACLTLACVLWTTIYDTIYAHQDLIDDRRLGLRSLAVLLGERATKPVLSLFLCTMVALLVISGHTAGAEGWWPFMIIGPCGCGLSLGRMVAYVKLNDSQSCWWWFRHGFWTAGLSITGALTMEYLVHQ